MSAKSRAVAWLGRRYVAGETLADALRVADALALPVTLGYWDAAGEEPGSVARAYAAALEALAGRDAYLSIKLPALGGDEARAGDLAARARDLGVTLHFDSLAEEHAERTLALSRDLSEAGTSVGASLPGRWSRSVADAAELAAAGVRVRVVKGQWEGDRDPARGFLDVVDAVAGAGGRAAAATHDPALARESLRRLGRAELELLYGLPRRAPEAVARELAAPLRMYVPYGAAYLPYALRQLRRNPRLLLWIARDAVSRGRV